MNSTPLLPPYGAAPSAYSIGNAAGAASTAAGRILRSGTPVTPSPGDGPATVTPYAARRIPLGEGGLIQALRVGDLASVECFMQAGADARLGAPNRWGRPGRSPIQTVINEHLPAALMDPLLDPLMPRHANPSLVVGGANWRGKFGIDRHPNESGDTLVLQAVRAVNPSALKALLGAGADATVADRSGMLPIDLAWNQQKRDPGNAVKAEMLVRLTPPIRLAQVLNELWAVVTDAVVRSVIPHLAAGDVPLLRNWILEQALPVMTDAQLDAISDRQRGLDRSLALQSELMRRPANLIVMMNRHEVLPDNVIRAVIGRLESGLVPSMGIHCLISALPHMTQRQLDEITAPQLLALTPRQQEWLTPSLARRIELMTHPDLLVDMPNRRPNDELPPPYTA